jgi:[ribosomal protein S18]-alanine N-acetyltransferase
MSTVLQAHRVIRPMEPEDIDAIMAVEQEIHISPWTRGNFIDSMQAGYSCWVFERNHEMVGYAVFMIVPEEAHLLNISISRPFHGQGLGRELLAHLIGVARSHRAQTMFLEMRVSNVAARRLYDGFGFNEISIRRGYYPAKNGREDAVLMGLAL